MRLANFSKIGKSHILKYTDYYKLYNILTFKKVGELVLILISILSFSSLSAQTLNGRIVDSLSVPIPYVNIGIKGQNIGTVSDENGYFSLELPTLKENSKIIISNIQYLPKEYTVKDFISLINLKKQIILDENKQVLEEVVVTSQKLKKDNLGNKVTSSMIEAGFKNNALGSEVGVKIKIKHKPTYIDSFNFSITSCEYDSLFFRLNIYDIKDGMPHKNLLSKNIYFSSNVKKGKVSIDLTEYDIVINKDIIITIEYIKELGQGKLNFSAGLLGKKVYHRQTSFSEWEKTGLISLGFNVDVRY